MKLIDEDEITSEPTHMGVKNSGGYKWLTWAGFKTLLNALYVPVARTVSGGGLVTGGGALSSNQTLTVTAATTEEAEAGAATNVAMTPATTAAAIAALAPAPDLSGYATEAYADAAVAAVVGAAPTGMNTLVEISNSLNGDTDFHGSMVSALTLKANASNAALTDVPTAPTAAPGTNTTQIATTAFANAAAAAIDKSDVGLGNCDNTSDEDKPISTATQTALDLKLTTTALLTALDALIASDGTLTLPSGRTILFNDVP